MPIETHNRGHIAERSDCPWSSPPRASPNRLRPTRLIEQPCRIFRSRWPGSFVTSAWKSRRIWRAGARPKILAENRRDANFRSLGLRAGKLARRCRHSLDSRRFKRVVELPVAKQPRALRRFHMFPREKGSFRCRGFDVPSRQCPRKAHTNQVTDRG